MLDRVVPLLAAAFGGTSAAWDIAAGVSSAMLSPRQARKVARTVGEGLTTRRDAFAALMGPPRADILCVGLILPLQTLPALLQVPAWLR